MKLRVGTRGSPLAVKQTQDVMQTMAQAFPQVELTMVEITTLGDIDLKSSFQEMNNKSVFTKELDEALLSNQIDLAVHSLKDLPSKDVKGLKLSWVTHAQDSRDVWVAREGKRFSDLKDHARIGTSSIRRQTILKEINPTFQVEGLRGNLTTRLKKLEESQLDGIILAAAGLTRLGWQSHITEFLPSDVFVPASGQGMIGVVAREDHSELNHQLLRMQDAIVWKIAKLQRDFMDQMDGGCRVPLGFCVNPNVAHNLWRFDGYLSNAAGTHVIRHHVEVAPDQCDEALKHFVSHFKSQGAKNIIASLRPQS